MKVKDILERKGRSVHYVHASDTVAVLCHRLRMDRVGALIVSDNGRELQGIVSERDVVACIAAHGGEGASVRVSEIMSARVVTCDEDDKISKVARQMSEHRFRHMPVMKNGVLTGIVSIGDIVKDRIEEVELEADVLRDMAMAVH